jgi:hypothetical protein
LYIPQFDFSTLSIVLFSSLLSAAVYYAFIALQLLPEVISTLKFRVKKLVTENFSLAMISLPNLVSYYFVLKTVPGQKK